MKVQEYPAIDSYWVLTLASKNEWFRSPGGCVLWWRGGGKLVLPLPFPTLGIQCTECLHQQTAVFDAMRPAWR